MWWWLRENFKLPSLAAIASVVAGSGLWIYNQRADLHALQAQQKTLATSDQVATVQSSLEALRTQLEDQGDRLDRLERNWDDAGRVAAETRVPKRRGR
jgi:Tfp pilus assembly protein PilO